MSNNRSLEFERISVYTSAIALTIFQIIYSEIWIRPHLSEHRPLVVFNLLLVTHAFLIFVLLLETILVIYFQLKSYRINRIQRPLHVSWI